MIGVYNITTNWAIFVKLLLSILMVSSTPASVEYRQVNSAITTLPVNLDPPSPSPHALTSTQQFDNVVQAYKDQVDCIHLYCCPVLSCIYARSEYTIRCGEVKSPIPLSLRVPCINQCYVCDSTHINTCLPIIFSGSIAFLESGRFGSVLGVEINVENGTDFVATLGLNKDWCKRVFGLAKLNTYNVTAFFL